MSSLPARANRGAPCPMIDPEIARLLPHLPCAALRGDWLWNTAPIWPQPAALPTQSPPFAPERVCKPRPKRLTGAKTASLNGVPDMTHPLRLGIAGLGTVGTGLVKLVQNNAALIEARAGRRIVISAVCAPLALAQSRRRYLGLCLGR